MGANLRSLFRGLKLLNLSNDRLSAIPAIPISVGSKLCTLHFDAQNGEFKVEELS